MVTRTNAHAARNAEYELGVGTVKCAIVGRIHVGSDRRGPAGPSIATERHETKAAYERKVANSTQNRHRRLRKET